MDNTDSPRAKHDNGMALYSPRDFAALIGRSTSTLKNWDRLGRLVANRYPSGQRYYTQIQLDQILNPSTPAE